MLQLKINRIPWKPLLIALVVLAVGWGSYGYYLENIRIEPEMLFQEAVQRTLAADSYRYHVQVTLLGTETGDNLLSNLDGEKQGENFHIKGELAKEQVEVFQVGSTTYSRRAEDSVWMKTPGNNPFEQTLFMAEINPISSFDFSSYTTLEYLGKEKVDGSKMYVLKYKPLLKEQLLTLYFEDFDYKIWVDRRSKVIKQAMISGKSRVTPEGSLEMQLKLWDYDKPLEIEAPEEPQK